MLYISVIRSLIDYAALVLVQFSASQLHPLEVLQSKAMQIILGCPRTARIEVLQAVAAPAKHCVGFRLHVAFLAT